MDLGGAVGLCPGGAPGLAKRRGVQTLRLEQPGARRKLLLALADAAAPRQRAEQRLVYALVERSKLEPLLQIAEDLLAASVAHELLDERGVAAAKAAPLRDEPSLEQGTAVDFQSLEKVAREQRGKRMKPLGRACTARAISVASTKQSERSSRTVSPRVSTLHRSG